MDHAREFFTGRQKCGLPGLAFTKLRRGTMTLCKITLISAVLLIAIAAFANDYGAVRGIVHDPQHRPVQDAMIMLKAKSSEWTKSVNTDATGQFQFNAVPLGEYSVSVASKGF